MISDKIEKKWELCFRGWRLHEHGGGLRGRGRGGEGGVSKPPLNNSKLLWLLHVCHDTTSRSEVRPFKNQEPADNQDAIIPELKNGA